MNHMEQRLQISYPADDLEQALEPEFRSRFARKMVLRASKGRGPSFRRVQSERHLPLTQSFRQSSLFSHNFGSTGSLLCPKINSEAEQLCGKVVIHKNTLRYSIILATLWIWLHWLHLVHKSHGLSFVFQYSIYTKFHKSVWFQIFVFHLTFMSLQLVTFVELLHRQ